MAVIIFLFTATLFGQVAPAGDFSWGSQKIVYYLGGVDGWMFPKYSA